MEEDLGGRRDDPADRGSGQGDRAETAGIEELVAVGG
jgi:hypothetical protein